ncbi:MAG: RpiB/LacA/LacB family sugar-phosphate isomerase [Suipraeoptans sp.]
MKIAFGVDPGGFELREGVLNHLKEKGYEVFDLGTKSMDAVIPYMEVGHNVAVSVTSGEADMGIVMCGTGMGISIATNKNKGARCALAENYYSVRESRIINDANIIALGGTTTSLRMACEMIDIFLETKFGQGLPEFRVERIKGGAENLAKFEDKMFK